MGTQKAVWDLSDPEVFGSGKVLSLVPRAYTPEPVHGGRSVGFALFFEAVCLPGFASPYMEVGFVRSPSAYFII